MKGTNPVSQGHRWLKRTKKRKRREEAEEADWEALEERKRRAAERKREAVAADGEHEHGESAKKGTTKSSVSVTASRNPFSTLASVAPKQKANVGVSKNPFSALTGLAPKPKQSCKPASSPPQQKSGPRHTKNAKVRVNKGFASD